MNERWNIFIVTMVFLVCCDLFSRVVFLLDGLSGFELMAISVVNIWLSEGEQ